MFRTFSALDVVRTTGTGTVMPLPRVGEDRGQLPGCDSPRSAKHFENPLHVGRLKRLGKHIMPPRLNTSVQTYSSANRAVTTRKGLVRQRLECRKKIFPIPDPPHRPSHSRYVNRRL